MTKYPEIGDARSERIALMMSEEQVRAIDDVRFARRLNSRAEAIRMLIEEGLKSFTAAEVTAGLKSDDGAENMADHDPSSSSTSGRTDDETTGR